MAFREVLIYLHPLFKFFSAGHNYEQYFSIKDLDRVQKDFELFSDGGQQSYSRKYLDKVHKELKTKQSEY